MRNKADGIKDSVRGFYNQHPQAQYGVLRKLALVKKIRGKRALEAGCGAGFFLFDYLMYGAVVTGIDQSAKSIEFIRQQCEILGFNPTLIVGDLETVELPDDSFDYISCIYVLHHTPRPAAVLEKFRRWCAKDGEMLLYISHKYSPDNLIRIFMTGLLKILPWLSWPIPRELKKRIHWEDRFEHPYWHPYSKREVQELCENNGWEVKKIYCAGFTVFLTFLIPPVITALLSRIFSPYIGKVVIVEAAPRKGLI